MKKRRTIAVVIACTALVLCVALVWGNWEQLAYSSFSAQSTTAGNFDGSPATVTYHLIRKKGVTWLPGRDEIVVDVSEARFWEFLEAQGAKRAREWNGKPK